VAVSRRGQRAGTAGQRNRGSRADGPWPAHWAWRTGAYRRRIGRSPDSIHRVMTDYQPNLLEIILVVSTIGLIPLAVVTLTGFLKISVVLFLIRNALGVQQTPPNLVLYGIALILAVYVTSPLMGEMYQEIEGRSITLERPEE